MRTKRRRRTDRHKRLDQHGSGYVQTLVLVATLGLGGVAAVRGLGGAIDEKATCAAEVIAGLGVGAVPCAESADGIPGLPGQDPDEAPFGLRRPGEPVAGEPDVVEPAIPEFGNEPIVVDLGDGLQAKLDVGEGGSLVDVDRTGESRGLTLVPGEETLVVVAPAEVDIGTGEAGARVNRLDPGLFFDVFEFFLDIDIDLEDITTIPEDGLDGVLPKFERTADGIRVTLNPPLTPPVVGLVFSIRQVDDDGDGVQDRVIINNGDIVIEEGAEPNFDIINNGRIIFETGDGDGDDGDGDDGDGDDGDEDDGDRDDGGRDDGDGEPPPTPPSPPRSDNPPEEPPPPPPEKPDPPPPPPDPPPAKPDPPDEDDTGGGGGEGGADERDDEANRQEREDGDGRGDQGGPNDRDDRDDRDPSPGPPDESTPIS